MNKISEIMDKTVTNAQKRLYQYVVKRTIRKHRKKMEREVIFIDNWLKTLS